MMSERMAADVWKPLVTVVVCGVLMLAGPLPAAHRAVHAASTAAPTPGEIERRVMTARSEARLASADMALAMYSGMSTSEAPTCTFKATMRVDQGRRVVQFGGRSPGLKCALAESRGLRPLFNDLEPVDTLMTRYELSVIDHKVVDGRAYYHVKGVARDPKRDPRGFFAWVDYDRGIIPEDILHYSWADLAETQTYDRLNNAFVLAQQVLFVKRYNVSLKITYSNFQFHPR
jgi:hypothetical protein